MEGTPLVLEGCHTKGPQTEGLKQQKCIFPQFWRLEVGGQGVSGLVSSEAFLFGV